LLLLGLWPGLAGAEDPSFTTEGVARATYRLGFSAAYAVMSQTVTATQSSLGRVEVPLARYGATPGPLTLSVLNSAGATIGHTTLTPTVTTDYRNPTWVAFPFSTPLSLTVGAVYTLRFEALQPNNQNHYFWTIDTWGTYPGGFWSLGATAYTRYDGPLRGYAAAGAGGGSTSPFDFALATPSSVTVVRPASGSTTVGHSITANVTSGTPSSVSFSQTGYPAGITSTALASCTPTCTTNHTISVASTAALGTSTVTVTGQSGALERTTTFEIEVISVPQPTTTGPLQYVRNVPLPSSARDVKRSGNRLFVGTVAGMSVLDITNPANPVLQGSVFVGGNKACNGVAVEGNFAYLACQSHFAIVDVTPGRAPAVLYNCAPASGNGRCNGVFTTVAPAGVANLWDVAVKDGVAMVSSFEGTVHFIDVTNPLAPTKLLFLGLQAFGNRVTLSVFNRLVNLDQDFRKGGLAGISVHGNRMIVSEWKYGHAHVYDVTNPRDPAYVGSHGFYYNIDTVTNGTWMFALGAYASRSGIWTKSLPPATGTYDERTSSTFTCPPECAFLRTVHIGIDQGGIGLTQSGLMAYYAGGAIPGILEVIDISNPAAPVSVATAALTTGGAYSVPMAYTVGVANSGDYIYVGVGTVGLQVYRFPGLED
jgi:hypothetical protein